MGPYRSIGDPVRDIMIDVLETVLHWADTNPEATKEELLRAIRNFLKKFKGGSDGTI